jgi:hypothetical protein
MGRSGRGLSVFARVALIACNGLFTHRGKPVGVMFGNVNRRTTTPPSVYCSMRLTLRTASLLSRRITMSSNPTCCLHLVDTCKASASHAMAQLTVSLPCSGKVCWMMVPAATALELFSVQCLLPCSRQRSRERFGLSPRIRVGGDCSCKLQPRSRKAKIIRHKHRDKLTVRRCIHHEWIVLEETCMTRPCDKLRLAIPCNIHPFPCGRSAMSVSDGRLLNASKH